jgi:hypothetical protein
MLGTIVIVGLIYAVGVLTGTVFTTLYYGKLRDDLVAAKAAVRWQHKG